MTWRPGSIVKSTDTRILAEAFAKELERLDPGQHRSLLLAARTETNEAELSEIVNKLMCALDNRNIGNYAFAGRIGDPYNYGFWPEGEADV